MEKNKKVEDLQSKLGHLLETKIAQLLETSPAKDIEKNLRAIMTQAFAKLDLVTKEECDLQAVQIAQLQEKLDSLEKRLIALEAIQVFSEKTTPPN